MTPDQFDYSENSSDRVNATTDAKDFDRLSAAARLLLDWLLSKANAEVESDHDVA